MQTQRLQSATAIKSYERKNSLRLRFDKCANKELSRIEPVTINVRLNNNWRFCSTAKDESTIAYATDVRRCTVEAYGLWQPTNACVLGLCVCVETKINRVIYFFANHTVFAIKENMSTETNLSKYNSATTNGLEDIEIECHWTCNGTRTRTT